MPTQTQTVSVEYTKLQINRPYSLCIVIMNPLKSKAAVPKLFPTLPPLVGNFVSDRDPPFLGDKPEVWCRAKIVRLRLRLQNTSSGSSNMTFSDPVAARHSASSRALSAFRTPRPALGRLQVGAGDIFSGSGSGV